MDGRKSLVGVLLLLLGGCAAAQPREPAPLDLYPPGGPSTPAWTPAPPIAVKAPPPIEMMPEGATEFEIEAGLKLRVLAAEGAMPKVARTVQLMRLERGAWVTMSEVNVPHMPGDEVTFYREDLPGYPGAIVMEASRHMGVRHGAVAMVDGELIALDYHRLAAPYPEITTGVFLFLNKYMNQVWVFEDGKLLETFPTANGRDPWGKQPTWKDVKTNYKTPTGLFPIKQKIVNPPYNNFGGNHPPAKGGAPDNPLGTRWIGFEVLPGDGGGIWGMHGTYVPDKIGTWASEGCVRLNTADAERLFDLVPKGAKIRIVNGI